MISASGFVALLGAIASFGNALPIDATAGHPTGAGYTGCTETSCLFSFTNTGPTPADNFCGEVDAASRMPDDIWANQSAVDAYVAATVKFYKIERSTLTANGCERAGNIPFDLFPEIDDTVPWTSPELMKATCGAVCGCNYPACPDVPDDPSRNGFCSLCGPKFNQPIIATYFKPGPSTLNECAPTFGPSDSICVPNPENRIARASWPTGQNRAACQARCDSMDRGGCCLFSSVIYGPPDYSYQADCFFYPEGRSAANATAPFLQTLPCIQPPPPAPSVCQRFSQGSFDCATDPGLPYGVYEPIVTWEGLTLAQAYRDCAAEGKTGCCDYRSTDGLTRFIAGGVINKTKLPTSHLTTACTEPPPPAPRPPAACQAFGSKPGIQCVANPNTAAPDRQPRQWFFVAPEVCFAECEKQGKTGCCDHRTDPSSLGICQFYDGGTPSLRPDPGGQYADMYAGFCIGPTCKTGLEYACGPAKKEGPFECGKCVVESKDQLTQCSKKEEGQFCAL